MKSKMTNRNKTFWIIAILVIALFFWTVKDRGGWGMKNGANSKGTDARMAVQKGEYTS